MARKHAVRRGDGFIAERVTSTGETRYQARWRDGVKWRSKTFGTVEDAEDHLRTVSRAKRAGTYEPESRLTVSDVLDGYMRRGKRNWKANTWSTYGGVIRFHIAPYLGHVRIVHLAHGRVQDWIDALVDKELSASVIENARVILNGACKEAIRLKLIRENPVTGVVMPSRTRPKYVTWTVEQAQAVIAACGDDLRMRTYYIVALTTGMRPGEIRALKWTDIDLEKARLTVERTITRDETGRQILGTTTKTKAKRTVALPPSTVAALRAWRVSQNERRLAARRWFPMDLVFDRGDGMILPQNTVARAHQRICADAGVPIIRMHDIRHTAATLLLEAGVHVKVVADLLGHSSTAITMDVYSHPGESIQRDATQALADALEHHG